MSCFAHRLIFGLSLFSLFLFLSCGRGETGKSNDSNTGSVSLFITDAPSDDFDSVYVTISEISLLGGSEKSVEDENDTQDAEKNNRITIFSGEKTIDLLALRDHAELFAMRSDVPTGMYRKLRMILKQNGLELVRKDDEGNVIERVFPSLTGNRKIDLLARKGLEVRPGENLSIQIDIDAGKSLHIIQTGNGAYRFRPVVFIEAVSGAIQTKLVRQSGELTEISVDGENIIVCRKAEDSSSCMQADITSASIFDELAEMVELTNSDVGKYVTVIGHVREAQNGVNGMPIVEVALVQIAPIGSYHRLYANLQAESAELPGDMMLETSEGEILRGRLQPNARIFSRAGAPLTVESLTIGKKMKLEGVFVDIDGESVFLITLIIVSPEAP
ncbi:MAG: DUF4382 domain-containing protein [Gammaproteobacteria bacterium]|nr:DUF4382 domain-containing protein [Gammaproteobacteria bacterium]